MASQYPSEWQRRHYLRARAAMTFPPVPQWPSGLSRRNQKLMSDRCGWPEGALLACWRLQHRHRGWHVSWMPANVTPGWEHPAGFWAVYDHHAHRTEVFSPSAEKLESLLADVPDHDWSVRGCAWCIDRL